MAREFIAPKGALVRPKKGAKLANPVWDKRWRFVRLTTNSNGEVLAELTSGWSGAPHAYIKPEDLEWLD